MRRDLANIEAGYYRMPHDMIEPPRKVLRDAVRFFRDLPEVQRRRQGEINAEVFEEKRREGIRPAALLSSELPLPDRRISQRPFRRIV